MENDEEMSIPAYNPITITYLQQIEDDMDEITEVSGRAREALSRSQVGVCAQSCTKQTLGETALF
eukprot:3504132-Amphidinium_carterae.3